MLVKWRELNKSELANRRPDNSCLLHIVQELKIIVQEK